MRLSGPVLASPGAALDQSVPTHVFDALSGQQGRLLHLRQLVGLPQDLDRERDTHGSKKVAHPGRLLTPGHGPLGLPYSLGRASAHSSPGLDITPRG